MIIIIIIIIIFILFSAIEGETAPENPYMIPSRKVDLLPPSEGMHEALFIINNSNRVINKEVHYYVQVHVDIGCTYTVIWEIFVPYIFQTLKFRTLNFRTRGSKIRTFRKKNCV